MAENQEKSAAPWELTPFDLAECAGCPKWNRRKCPPKSEINAAVEKINAALAVRDSMRAKHGG